MTLFDKVSEKRNKINNRYIKKYVRKYVRRTKREVRWLVRNGELSENISVYEVSDLPIGLIEIIYERAADELNSYYQGQVRVEVEFYNDGNYKGLKATIVKV